MYKYFLFAFVITLAITVDPPIWADSFQVAFDQEFKTPNATYIVNGILYYDAKNTRSRLDRTNGQYDKFCNSLSPDTRTPCTHLTTDGKRYIIFPEKSQCCFCCDAAHGCGILKKDWLVGAQYLGRQNINNIPYDKWNQQGVVGYNYYYATTDANQYPKKIDENGGNIFDFNIYSYIEHDLDSKLFSVPSYCKSNCPAGSMCGKHQMTGQKLLRQQ